MICSPGSWNTAHNERVPSALTAEEATNAKHARMRTNLLQFSPTLLSSVYAMVLTDGAPIRAGNEEDPNEESSK